MSHRRADLILQTRPLRHAGLASNSIGETTIADRLGNYRSLKGNASQFGLRKGLSFTAFDLTYDRPFSEPASTDACFVAVVLLEAGGRSILTGRTSTQPFTLDYTAGTTMYFLARAPLAGRFDVPPGSRFRGIDLRLSLEHLRHLDVLPSSLDAFHPFCSIANADVWVGRKPTAGTTRDRANNILTAALSGNGSDLDMEVGALSVLNDVLAELKAAPVAASSRQRQRFARLDAARRLLLDDIATPWTVGDLAKAADLSESQLKSGFKEQFGAPVYEYLQKARLEKARTMLATGEASVTEVALAVGYANPSHFAYLFRRAYGVSPTGRPDKCQRSTSPP